MPKNRRGSCNGTTMIAIPDLSQNQVILMIKQRHELKREREQMNDKIRQMRKTAYNLTLKINEFEDKIEAYVLKNMG